MLQPLDDLTEREKAAFAVPRCFGHALIPAGAVGACNQSFPRLAGKAKNNTAIEPRGYRLRTVEFRGKDGEHGKVMSADL